MLSLKSILDFRENIVRVDVLLVLLPFIVIRTLFKIIAVLDLFLQLFTVSKLRALT
jgi:hypothetical protein